MILVDSSGWIEFLVGGPLAERYEAYLSQPSQIITPTIVLHEAYKKIKRERTEEDALIVAAQMHKTRLVPLTETLALSAADVSLEHQLAMADSIVYATALSYQAQLITSDKDFRTSAWPAAGRLACDAGHHCRERVLGGARGLKGSFVLQRSLSRWRRMRSTTRGSGGVSKARLPSCSCCSASMAREGRLI